MKRRSATSSSPPEPTFFVDRNLGRYIFPDRLREAGVKLEAHDDHFSPGEQDPVWIAEAGRRGWVVLTADGRGLMGNAIYRDLIQATVMAGVDYLCLAVANSYKYKSGGRTNTSRDYEKTIQVAEALYGHSRMQLPYGLIVIGY